MTTRILLIEDNPADVYLIREALAPGGNAEWVVDAAENGAAALRILEGCAPDLIILDLNLPRTDSTELARAIRHRPELSRTILVTWTSSPRPAQPSLMAEIGVERHFVKPLEWRDYEEIARLLREMIAARRAAGGGAAH